MSAKNDPDRVERHCPECWPPNISEPFRFCPHVGRKDEITRMVEAARRAGRTEQVYPFSQAPLPHETDPRQK